MKTACPTIWHNAVYVFRYYLEISIIDQKLVWSLSFANKAGHFLLHVFILTFSNFHFISHSSNLVLFALWKAIGHIQLTLNLWRKKVPYINWSVTEMSWYIAKIWFVLNATTDGLIIEMLIWIFTKPKLIWCNVDFDNVLILPGLWKKLIIKVHWRTHVSMVQFSIAVS